MNIALWLVELNELTLKSLKYDFQICQFPNYMSQISKNEAEL